MALNDETQALYDKAAGNSGQPAEGASPSLADHEAAFSNAPRLTPSPSPGDAAPDDATDSPRPRHRARSQTAKPDDVEKITALTARLRDAEKAAGIEVEREDGESDRVYNLRRRAVLAEALAKPKEHPKPVARPVAPPTQFAEAEPQIEQFANTADPYTAWLRATHAYDRRKEAADAQSAQQTEFVQRAKAQAVENKRQAYAGFNTRVESFRATTPDYDAIVKTCEQPVTYLMETAMVNDADGARYAYELAKNPVLHDEIFILTDNKPVTRETVASVQRLLKARIPQPAAVTGSAASVARPLAPRPPNPVRTVPSAHLPKAPSDTASLADHEAFYGIAKRR